MPKFKRQLVPGDYLTAADMLHVLSQQQLSAAALQGSILLAAQPAMAWLLDCCCIGKTVAADTPVFGSSSAPAAAPGAAAAAAMALAATVAAAGVNCASAELQQQYELSLQEAAVRRQRRGRKGGGSASFAAHVAAGGKAAAAAAVPAAVPVSEHHSVQQQQEQQQQQQEQEQHQARQTAGSRLCAAAVTRELSAPAAGDVQTVSAAGVGGLPEDAAADAAAAEAANGSSSAGPAHQQAAVVARVPVSVGASSYGGAAEELQLVQLSCQEAYFLASVLRCCQVAVVVCQSAPACCQADTHSQHQQQQQQQLRKLSTRELWGWCCDNCAGGAVSFVTRYAAYQHFRSKGWIPQPGLIFGADYVLYELHPEYVHSDYAVSIMLEVQPQPWAAAAAAAVQAPSPVAETAAQAGAQTADGRLPARAAAAAEWSSAEVAHGVGAEQTVAGDTCSSTQLLWLDAHIMQRLTRQVLKQLLLFYVVVPQGLQLRSPDCMQLLAVREVLMQRWQPSAADNRGLKQRD